MRRLFYLSLCFLFLNSCSEDMASGSEGPGSGQGGSLARFAVIGNYLYSVHGTELKVFDISTRSNPVYLSNFNLNVDVETIFKRDMNTLFIGSTSGMFIYDVSAAPAIDFVSSYQHIVSCDPVVADNDYAYVTLRSDDNNRCFRDINRLDIVDIRNMRSPDLIYSLPLVRPLGLAIYGDTLLVCDVGVKVFDVADPRNPQLINAIEEIPARDIIANGDLMIVLRNDGLEQYRYKNGELQFLSAL